nr:transglycosylase domain-containing protein [Chamaesiphon sp. VAR_48_metabat_135_sub]
MGRKPENGSFFGGIGQIAGGTILGVTMLASSIVAGGLVGLAISFRNLPDVRVLRSYAPTETTYIYDVKGVQLASLHDEANREVVPLNRISPNLKRSLLAIEDSHFYYHQGVNLTGVGRAITANFKKGGVSEGGSTITMQLIKNLFLSQKRQFSRKLAEAVLSIRLEQIFRKDEILEMYLNQVYWGHNNYGVETAAQSYFNKHASDLNLAEGAMMAGAIAAPEKYSPFTNFKSAKKRQEQVLNRMVELNWITAADAKKAKDYKIKLGKIKTWQSSRLPYVTDTAIEELNQRFGRETVRKGGMRIQTTIDYNFQMAAQKVVANAYDRLGRNKYQISLVAIDPRTHFVKAMVGGVDYKKSNFNRAMYANRQPGSSFKPFVYYTAFATGKFTPDSTVYDTPVRYRDGSGYYAPRNYGGGYSGPMSIRSAIMTSANVPAVKMGKEVGLDKVIQTCRTLGIKSPIEPVVSLPLGAIGVTPVEMAGAFATFASNGWQSETTTILRVTDSDGNVLLDNTPQPQQVLNPWATAQINSALQSVVSGGTGKQAYLGRPAAGKTGTTSSERDVWFVGYVPQLAASVWIGKDDYTPLGKGVTGGTYAAPIWRSFMQEALQNEPVESFQSPAKFKRPGS